MNEVKNITSFRIKPETINRVKALAEGQGVTTSAFVSSLLDAYTERRVIVLTDPVGHIIVDGTDPEHPLVVEG
jgi:hypothetical protein